MTGLGEKSFYGDGRWQSLKSTTNEYGPWDGTLMGTGVPWESSINTEEDPVDPLRLITFLCSRTGGTEFVCWLFRLHLNLEDRPNRFRKRQSRHPPSRNDRRVRVERVRKRPYIGLTSVVFWQTRVEGLRQRSSTLTSVRLCILDLFYKHDPCTLKFV